MGDELNCVKPLPESTVIFRKFADKILRFKAGERPAEGRIKAGNRLQGLCPLTCFMPLNGAPAVLKTFSVPLSLKCAKKRIFIINFARGVIESAVERFSDILSAFDTKNIVFCRLREPRVSSKGGGPPLICRGGFCVGVIYFMGVLSILL